MKKFTQFLDFHSIVELICSKNSESLQLAVAKHTEKSRLHSSTSNGDYETFCNSLLYFSLAFCDPG